MNQEKKSALIVLAVAVLITVVASVMFGIIMLTFLPILVTFLLILVGMSAKWAVEWCITNRHIFKIKENAKKVKDKLKVDEGVRIVKHSYDVLKNKEK